MATGRRPKPEGMKAGHGSVKATKAVLPVEANKAAPVPPLPAHPLGSKWHPLCIKVWEDIWHSPMAGQYLEADIPGLYRIVVLTQSFMEAPNASISAELRQLSFNYGLSPMDRRRLQWTILRTDEAMKDAEVRRSRKAERVIPGDPRDVLK